MRIRTLKLFRKSEMPIAKQDAEYLPTWTVSIITKVILFSRQFISAGGRIENHVYDNFTLPIPSNRTKMNIDNMNDAVS